jgi:hypothetical protein
VRVAVRHSTARLIADAVVNIRPDVDHPLAELIAHRVVREAEDKGSVQWDALVDATLTRLPIAMTAVTTAIAEAPDLTDNVPLVIEHDGTDPDSATGRFRRALVDHVFGPARGSA